MEILNDDPPGQAPERVDFVRDLVLTGRSDDDIESLLGPAGRAEAAAIRRHEDLTPEARAGRRAKFMEKAFAKLSRAVLSAGEDDLKTLINGVNAITRLNKTILETDRAACSGVSAFPDSEDDQPADDPDAEETQNGKFEYAQGFLTKGSAGRAIVTDICMRGGVEVDASRLTGIVDGYMLDGVSSARGALEPLRASFGFNAVERGGQIVFEMQAVDTHNQIGLQELTGDGAQLTHRLLDKVPGALRLTYVEAGGDYQPATLQAVNTSGDRSYTLDAQIPMLLTEAQGERLAAYLLAKAGGGDSAKIGVPVGRSEIEPGDLVQLEGRGQTWRVTDISDGLARALQLEAFVAPALGPRGAAGSGAIKPAVFGPPELLVIDGPALPGEESDTRPLVAATTDPWPGLVRVSAGPDAAALTERAVITRRAGIGVLLADVPPGPVGRWDRGSKVEVNIPGAALASESQAAVLAGANALLVQSEAGWELLNFQAADLIGVDTYRLTGLLRGQQGSDAGALVEGARCVVLDSALVRAELSPAELGLELVWSATGRGQVSAAQTYEHDARSSLPWRPGHLRAIPAAGGLSLNWTRRAADISDSWALPEAAYTGRFIAEFLGADGVITSQKVASAEWLYEGDVSAVTTARVAEIGPDGRIGAATMIAI